MNPLHASYYADHAIQHTARIVENEQLAKDTFRVRLTCPELASRAVPGQFLMLKIAGYQDPLIGRPFAIFDVGPGEGFAVDYVDVVYLVKGKLSTALAKLRRKQLIEVWGPLGNGFDPSPVDHLIMVAGGIGQTPFLTLGQEFLGTRKFGSPAREVKPAKKVTLLYGARTAEYLAGVESFEAAGIDVRIATNDGSRGRQGLVTDLLDEILTEKAYASRRVVCCGPEPMMHAASEVALRHSAPCQVSLETPMACGIGICFTCVAKVKTPEGDWDYKRTCVEGPVFDAEKIIW